ncbi:MAG: type III-A CRISPR-associated protein Csm2 [Selenomonadaceae bacterium]|nr:type III-A CRISPR-associated protein Csm2 [Selenomonadaceae bacterium]
MEYKYKNGSKGCNNSRSNYAPRDVIDPSKYKDMDIISRAEAVIKDLPKDEQEDGGFLLKTNQIRKILAAVNSASNKVSVFKATSGSTELNNALADEIRYLQVLLVYQCGRDKQKKKQCGVDDFVKRAGLIDMIKSIGKDIRKYEEFARYMEALVAYHKFYGGKD